MIILGSLLVLVVAWLWLPNLTDAGALFRRFSRIDSARPLALGARLPRLVFIVPAHNEALLIHDCVASLVSMDYPPSRRRVIVIADNCTDETARIAREARAECFERFDLVHPGKPHALAWLLRRLSLTDAEAYVIVDADTVVAPSFARGFAALSPLEDIAAQAFVGTLNEWDNWLTRLAGVLARCRYQVTYPLRDEAGLQCPLTGNGMCIGRNLLVKDGWQAFSLTENWELYARYTAEGVPIRFAPGARLFTQQVRSMSQGRTQRSRWLAGRSWVLRTWAARILRSRSASVLDKLATLGELAGLSPVLHLMAALGTAVIALILPAPWAAVVGSLALASLASPVITTMKVLARHPHPASTAAAFLRLPVYAVWRASVAAGTLLLPSSGEWRKTERHST